MHKLTNTRLDSVTVTDRQVCVSHPKNTQSSLLIWHQLQMAMASFRIQTISLKCCNEAFTKMSRFFISRGVIQYSVSQMISEPLNLKLFSDERRGMLDNLLLSPWRIANRRSVKPIFSSTGVMVREEEDERWATNPVQQDFNTSFRVPPRRSVSLGVNGVCREE